MLPEYGHRMGVKSKRGGEDFVIANGGDSRSAFECWIAGFFHQGERGWALGKRMRWGMKSAVDDEEGFLD